MENPEEHVPDLTLRDYQNCGNCTNSKYQPGAGPFHMGCEAYMEQALLNRTFIKRNPHDVYLVTAPDNWCTNWNQE